MIDAFLPFGNALLIEAFFHTHHPSFVGKQFGYLLSGSLGQNANLRQVLEAYVEMSYANLVGIITDEAANSQDLDNQLDYFSKRLSIPQKPQNVGFPTTSMEDKATESNDPFLPDSFRQEKDTRKDKRYDASTS